MRVDDLRPPRPAHAGRAVWILINRAGVTSLRARHTVGGDASEHAAMVALHIDVRHHFTVVSEHHHDVGQNPAAVVDRDERAACHHLRQLRGQGARSANGRSPTLPARATTPTPSADTDRPYKTTIGVRVR